MAFTSFLGAAGAPVDTVLRRCRLPVMCTDPNGFVPLLRAWSFFEDMAAHEDPRLGWLVGEWAGDHYLNQVRLAMLEDSPSLYQALKRLIYEANKEASDIQLGLYERQDDVLIFTHYPGMIELAGYEQAQAYQLGVILGLIQHFLGRRWFPDEIGLESRRPQPGIKTFFPGARILMGQTAGFLAVPRASLHRSAPHVVSGQPWADAPEPSDALDFVGKLRGMVKSYLPDGYMSAKTAANMMDFSERTLARRLAENDLSYGKIVDEARFALAKKLLLTPGVKIEDVALEVGFNDQSNFTRMFRRIGGLSPTEFRKSVSH